MKRIEAIYAWIATHEDGSESIVSGDMPFAPELGGRRDIPLVAIRRDTAENLALLARRQVGRTGRENPILRVALRSFNAAVVENPITGLTWVP